MLPPFVPPSARAPTESLPLITQFVIDRSEARASTIGPDGATAVAERDLGAGSEQDWGAGEAIPSIEEFVRWQAPQPPGERPAGDEPVRPPEPGHAAAHAASRTPERAAAPGEGSRTVTVIAAAAVIEETVAAPAESPQPAAGAAEAAWVSEERDAFDWGGVATLATRADDEHRAAEEWSSTQWDRPAASPESEHIATLLMQLARRVRAGELQVATHRQMGTEAALAAVLTALLSGAPDAPHG